MTIAFTTLFSLGARSASGTTAKMGHGTEFKELLDHLSSARAAPVTSEAPGNGSSFSTRSLLASDLLNLTSSPAAPGATPALSAEPDVADAPAAEDAEALSSGTTSAGVADANGFDAKTAALSALPVRGAPLIPEMEMPGNTAG
jgi:hypothetical protein